MPQARPHPAPPGGKPPAGRTRRITAEIFSAGTWNGETFTAEDLAEIADNFRRLQAHLQPPLKFGHDEGQTLLGQADGDPALGWVEALQVDGDRLVATFAGVPPVVEEAIRAGRYRKVSAELYLDVRHRGRRLGKALKAVALLGADLPAVTNLQDLGSYLTQAPPPEGPSGEVRAFTLAVERGRIDPGTQDAADPREAELAELRAYKARAERLRIDEELARREQSFRAERAAAARVAEAAVAGGRLAPYLRDRLLAELDAQHHTFSAEQPLKVSFDWVQRFLEQGEPLPAGETAAAPPPREREPEAGEADNPSLELARLATARMTELNLGYADAAAYVLRTHPRLARAYREYTLNAHRGA